MNTRDDKQLKSIAKKLTKKNSDLCICMILNFSNNSERIIIGSKLDIQNKLLKYENSNQIIFDKKRDIGQLFFDINDVDKVKWQYVINEMRNRLWNLTALEKDTREFLFSHNNSANPINIFLALCLRKEYYKNKKDLPTKKQREIFNNNVMAKTAYISGFQTIMGSLSLDLSNEKKTYKSNLPILPEYMSENEFVGADCTIWYTPNLNVQCIFSSGDLYPVLQHYIYQLREHKLRFQICTYCNKYFLTHNLKNRLCSEECKIASKSKVQEKYKETHTGKTEEKSYSRLRMQLNRKIKNDNILNQEQKKELKEFAAEILGVAKEGKQKIYGEVADAEVYKKKLKTYEETFSLYHECYTIYINFLSDVKYSDTKKNKIRQFFLPTKDVIISDLKKIEDSKITLDDHKKNRKDLYDSFKQLINEL